MSVEEFDYFVNKLNALSTDSENKMYAEEFFCCKKYNNQFSANGIIDQFVSMLNRLRNQ